MSGTTKTVLGRIKQAAGVLTGNKDLARDGRRDQRLGSVEKTADDANDAVHDRIDETIENVSDRT